MLKSLRQAAFLLALLGSVSASAAVARLEVIGTISGIEGDQVMTATFLFDTSTPGEFADTDSVQYQASLIEGTVVFGDSVYIARTPLGSNNLVIRNTGSSSSDLFGFQAEIESESGDTGLFALELFDDSGQVFDTTDFPLTSFDLSDFNASDTDIVRASVFQLFGVDGVDQPLPGYEMTSVTYAVVPIPAAGWLLFSTLAGLGLLRRR